MQEQNHDPKKRRIAVLWTGGKDSFLALHRISERPDLEIACLVTFVPGNNFQCGFKAHPQSLISNQAKALGIPQSFVEISEPYREEYVSALRKLKVEFDLDAVATGDIDSIGGLPNWISERCAEVGGLEAMLPLWKQDRVVLLNELVKRGIIARITLINDERMPASWKGLILDEMGIAGLLELASKYEGFDPCGEYGEYHTMVIASPLFQTEEQVYKKPQECVKKRERLRGALHPKSTPSSWREFRRSPRGPCRA